MSSDKNKVYDVAIVGYGPAGVTAGIYIARKRLRAVLIGELPGGEVLNSGEIENWPGGRKTDGNTLAQSLVDHLQDHSDQIDTVQDTVKKIAKKDDVFLLSTKAGKTFSSTAVIYAAGRHPRKLCVPGEDSYQHKGVTYCATCDAPLFADKDVAVIGGGNTGAEAVIMLQNIARKIYLLHNKEFLSADPILVSAFENDPKVDIMYNTHTKCIEGDHVVQKLVYEDTPSGEEKELYVQGIFVSIGAVPNSDPVKDLVELDQYGAIKSDRYGHTNADGFFAAGDVTDIRDAQIVVAAGHGCSAALSAGEYLSRKRIK